MVRDELDEVFADAEFAQAFADRGTAGWSPGRLALVTVLLMAENLTDRQDAEAVRDKISWKYALGLTLTDSGFDFSVLSQFRSRIVEHGLEGRVLDLLVAALVDKGLLQAGGKQRTDSTHVVAAVRDLNRLELAGESVHACVEAIAVAAPDWLAATIDVAGWGQRYGLRVDSWRLPTSKTKRDALASAYGRDGFALLSAVYAPTTPGWLAELTAVEVLRIVLVQNYTRTIDRNGREVVKMREADTDGLPPGRCRLTSPYDPDARWGGKRDMTWNGYKLHISETCDADAAPVDLDGGVPEAPPNLITNVATTDASVPDVAMTEPIHEDLARRDLLPAEQYLESGYPSADLLTHRSDARHCPGRPDTPAVHRDRPDSVDHGGQRPGAPRQPGGEPGVTARLTLIKPGLVWAPRWRPDPAANRPTGVRTVRAHRIDPRPPTGRDRPGSARRRPGAGRG